jgi:outer membrane receptor protein involved in Fe transport
VSAQATYTWNNTLSLMAGTQFRDAQFLNDQNTLSLDSFQVANVAATYYRGPMQFNFTISNLTDTFYYSGIRGNTQFYPGEPRRYQATMRWEIR